MLRPLSPAEGQEVREFLRDSGYTTQALKAQFGLTVIPHVQLLRLYGNGIALQHSRLNTLFRWFWIGCPVDQAIAGAWIPERILDLFIRVAVLEAGGGFLTSPYRISPFNQLFIFSDHAGSLREDTVLWPNPTTRLCFDLAMKAPVARTLDFGTGNGVLALAAAAHSGSVLATDLNARARAFCAFNAALHGIENVEFREGDSFSPVRGERFDLILANPPFFVTPSVRHVFSDNSMELDGFCRNLVRQAPDYLNDNGYCQLLAEWVQLRGQPWRERLREWFAGLPCDAWVTAISMKPSLDYALRRIREDGDENADPAGQAALTQSWQRYFEDRGVEAIYSGMIVMRRKTGKAWLRMEEITSVPSRPFGEFMRRLMETCDYLESCSDEQLAGSRPALAPSAQLEQQFAPTSNGWKRIAIHLRLAEGLPYSLALQPAVADFLASCNGEKTVAELADQMAANLCVEPALVRKESCGIVRQAAGRGMLII